MKRVTLFACAVFQLAIFSCLAEPKWLPTQSTHNGTNFYQLSIPVQGDWPGFGTTATNKWGPPDGTNAFAGPAPQEIGLTNRPGHFYFGFANKYPTNDDFAAYELGGTELTNGTTLMLKFSKEENDRINFIGMVADGAAYVSYTNNSTNFTIIVNIVDPVYSQRGDGDQTAVCGLYVNYGTNETHNTNVNYGGSVFATDIHWWDIDVPQVHRYGTASIKLATSNETAGYVYAFLPDSFFTNQGIAVSEIQGYVDTNELPLNDVGNYGYTNLGAVSGFDFDGGSEDDATKFRIKNDQWSSRDLRVGVMAADGDGDGMNDNWEIAHFSDMSRDGTEDFDSDGLTDWEEWVAGTVPTNKADCFKITDVSVVATNNNDIVLVWNTVSGKFYRVRTTTNLMAPASWANVTNSAYTNIMGMGVPITYTNDYKDNIKRYFRIGVEAGP